MYELLKKDGMAKRGRFHTVHGTIETPVFMNVGTAAAIKGAVSTDDLRGIGTQVELSNTYHLHVRPGDEIVKKLGGRVTGEPVLFYGERLTPAVLERGRFENADSGSFF